MKANNFWTAACIIGALAVVLGAFGAHTLKSKIGAYELDIYKTAVFYHFVHAVMMVITAWLYGAHKNVKAANAFVFFGLGIAMFSGSLYLLATRSLTGIPPSILGPLTPIGGVFFILGWLFLIKSKSDIHGSKI